MMGHQGTGTWEDGPWGDRPWGRRRRVVESDSSVH